MTTKVVRLEIVKPLNIEWKQFGAILYRIQWETRMIYNKSTSLAWEFSEYSSEYFKRYSAYPDERETLGFSLQGYIYDKLKDSTILYTSNSSQSQQKAWKKWNESKIEIFKGNKSIFNYKKDIPIDVASKAINISKDSNRYTVSLNLLNKQGVKEFELKSSRVDVAVKVKSNSVKSILERVISGEYKIGGSMLTKNKRKKKWFILLTYSFNPVKDTALNKENIMGIDMGICNPVYVAYNNSLKRFCIEGDEITAFRKKIYNRRNALLKQGKYCGEGRYGHGRRTRLKPIEKLQDRVENFKRTTNHKYSKKIVELALQQRCGVIQMEDLKGVAADEKKATFLGNWTYYDLQEKIENKAKERGIVVVKIDPKYTSQRCSECGYIHKDNRPKGEKGQSYFKCVECGFEAHADYNAAKNIATKNIEKIIEKQIKKQGGITKQTNGEAQSHEQ